MRTDLGRRRFHAAGWLATAGVATVTFVLWRAHVRKVEQRAEEAERTWNEVARSTLDTLRRDDDGGVGLDRLPALVDRARSSGLPITVTVEGTPRPLPPDVEQAAYRVVQEALTNVGRHAGGATARVRLRYGASLLKLQVDDDGSAPRQPPVPRAPGHGLIGMRERVAALGGSLRAGPGPTVGFTVVAELPTGSAGGPPAKGRP